MFYLLLVIHFVSDALLQSRDMGKKKSSEPKYLAAHLAIIFFCFLPFTGFWFSLSNVVVHGLIDWHIWRGYKLLVMKRFPNADTSFQYWEDRWFYATILFDQALHVATLYFLMENLLK